MKWLFHNRRAEGLGEFTRKSRLLSRDEIEQGRRWEPSVVEGVPYINLTQSSAWPLFVGLEALSQRRDAICAILNPFHEKTALVSFVGMGITDANRYEDAATTFSEFRRMAPTHNGALIQVFRLKHREGSRGSDFLYLHFAGDRLSFGFLICSLMSGGFMAGWQLS